MMLSLAACGGDKDGGSAAPPVGAAGSSGEGPCSSLKESTIEELFDVAVTAAPGNLNGPTFCHFGIDGTSGNGFDVTALSETVETFDQAVDTMESESGAAEGSGLQQLDVGDKAAGFANSGLAFVVVKVGDQIVQVTANVPQAHPLAADDNALLRKTAELAGQVV